MEAIPEDVISQDVFKSTKQLTTSMSVMDNVDNTNEHFKRRLSMPTTTILLENVPDDM